MEMDTWQNIEEMRMRDLNAAGKVPGRNVRAIGGDSHSPGYLFWLNKSYRSRCSESVSGQQEACRHIFFGGILDKLQC